MTLNDLGFIPIGSRLSTETSYGNAYCDAYCGCFIPIGSRLSTETRRAASSRRTVESFIPIGSRLSTETFLSSVSAPSNTTLHPHRLAVEH